MHNRVSLVSLVALCLAQACAVFGPTQDALLPSSASELEFQGLVTAPNQEVRLQARDARGAFVTFATARSARTAMVLPNGTRVYPWSARSAVSPWSEGECGPEAFVRAVVVVLRTEVALTTFTPQGAACVQRAMAEGTSYQDAITRCGASDGASMPIRLEAEPLHHPGDLVVTTQAEADALQCVTHVDGDLTITGVEPSVALPRLREVSGDLLITLGLVVSSSGPAYGRAELPRLRRVGGELRLTAVAWGASFPSPAADFGMPALSEVGRDLEITLEQFNTEPSGLPSLLELQGALRFTTLRGSDVSASRLLRGLERVHGDVTLSGGHNVGSLLPALRRVDGDVLVREMAIPGGALPELERVEGELTLEAVGSASVPTARLGRMTPLSVGALSVLDTPHDQIPLHDSARVDAEGAIHFRDNASVCTSLIDAFVLVQRAAGWRGALDTSGNGGC